MKIGITLALCCRPRVFLPCRHPDVADLAAVKEFKPLPPADIV